MHLVKCISLRHYLRDSFCRLFSKLFRMQGKNIILFKNGESHILHHFTKLFLTKKLLPII